MVVFEDVDVVVEVDVEGDTQKQVENSTQKDELNHARYDSVEGHDDFKKVADVVGLVLEVGDE